MSYIGAGSDKLPDPDFISGVAKIQRNQEVIMTEDEKEACEHLKAPADANNPEEGNHTLTIRESLEMRKKHKVACLEDRYKNVDYICGPAAEVERLWNVAKHVLTTQRMGLTQLSFEALMFMKVNKCFFFCHSIIVSPLHGESGRQYSSAFGKCFTM